MSSIGVENLHDRIRLELERLGLTQAEAARRMGEPDSQNLRDVCSGRKRVTAEFLTKLATIHVDVLFVLTGQKDSASAIKHEAEMQSLRRLQNRGIYPDGEGGGRVSSAGLALLLDYVRESKDNRTTKLTAKELQKVSSFVPKDAREWLLQPVALTPYKEGKSNHVLLIFRRRTPVSVVWKIGPFPGQIPSRIDLTTDSELPLKSTGDDEDDDVRWQLDLTLDGAHGNLLQGVELRANPIPIDFAHKKMAVQKIVNVQVGGDVGQSIAGDATFSAPVSFGSPKARK